MVPAHIFINGCSFLTNRAKEGVLTHTGLELSKLMELDIAESLAAGGRGNRRISFTTKVWCEKNPELAKKCFFLIGITSGTRFDYPTKDGYKKRKFPSLDTTWKTFSIHQDKHAEDYFKHLFGFGMDIDQHIQIESINTKVKLYYIYEFTNQLHNSFESY